MSWTSAFPVLSEEMVREYSAGATKEERAELEEWFGVQKVINPTPGPRHLVSFSLFWKNRTAAEPDLPPLNRNLLETASRRGLVSKYDPWSHYVEPLLDTAGLVLKAREDVAFRVYLAADLEFLVKDLVRVGCEVCLMKSSSVRHNPGAMWRFLALEEKGRMVTVSDSDRARVVEADLLRTEETTKAGLALWRVPVWGDIGREGTVPYRPMVATHFGGCPRLPMRKLLMAFVWQQRRGSIATTCQIPMCGERPIAGTAWPDYGVDEYFLLATVYPRAARKGILSFVPSDARSQLLLLDIEYATWANPRSELVYFGNNGACCAPRPGAPTIGIPNKETPGLMALEDFTVLDPEGLTQRHRLPPFARRPQPHRQDITGRVWAWFNPASVVWQGKRWLAYRTECSPMWHWTRTSLVNLEEKPIVGRLCETAEGAAQTGTDAVSQRRPTMGDTVPFEFRPIAGTNQMLDLPTGFGRWGAEDPRFTIWEDRLFLSYSDAYRTGLAEISAAGKVISAGLLPNDFTVPGVTTEKDRREKNWGFFGYGNRLFVAYWVNPHVVFECDPHTRKLGQFFSTPWTPPVETTRMHGGSTPILHDGLYWRVVHSSPPAQNGRRVYRLWLMAFSDAPPFAPMKFCTEPLVVAQPEQATRPEPIAHDVVFCSSLERLEKGWLIFFGENDLRIRYGVIADEWIEPHLKSVEKPLELAVSRIAGAVSETDGTVANRAPQILVPPSANHARKDPRIPCFWDGIGDVFMQCCTTDRYQTLSNPEPPEIVVVVSWNEYLDEYFRWHPNADRFKVMRATPRHGIKASDPEFFKALGLPPSRHYAGKKRIDWDTKFFPSPEDAKGLAWVSERKYGVFAPYSKERKTIPEAILLTLLPRLQGWLAGSPRELFGMGRNYPRENRQVQDFQRFADHGWITDLSGHHFSVPAAIETARGADFYVGADSCLALVALSRGIPTVIIEPDDHSPSTRKPKLFDLERCLLVQKFGSFDLEAVVAFLAERIALDANAKGSTIPTARIASPDFNSD
jgi:hypothetical protein